MTSLKHCPFCGGEARHYAPGPIEHHIECTNPKCYAVTHGWSTEAEAIAAWNTRAIDRRPYELRITGDGSDWGEIMRDAYDDLMANACEECTPEQMEQLFDYIRAELGSGTCEWLYPQGVAGWVGYAECSNCGYRVYEDMIDEREWTYCPNCGRKVVDEC